MGYEVLVILFVVLSVISSIINKLQEAKKQRELESSPKGQKRGASRPVLDEEVDLSDLFPGLELPKPPTPREFREVRGTRRVSEEDTGEEFEEVHGTRPVSEADTGREFREVRGTRPVTEEQVEEEPTPSATGPESDVVPIAYRRKKRRRRMRLDFKPDSVKKAIVYSEILGPPRSERMYD